MKYQIVCVTDRFGRTSWNIEEAMRVLDGGWIESPTVLANCLTFVEAEQLARNLRPQKRTVVREWEAE